MTLAEWRRRQSGAASPRPEEDAALRCPRERLKSTKPPLSRAHCADRGDHFLPVRTAKMDVTLEGIYDLAGNVSEWVMTPDGAYARGGSWARDESACDSRYSVALQAAEGYEDVGFRCARDASRWEVLCIGR